MDQGFIDRMCRGIGSGASACLYEWEARPPGDEPGLERPKVPVCNYLRGQGLKGAEAVEFIKQYVDPPGGVDGVMIDNYDKKGIPCSLYKECPNTKKVEKYGAFVKNTTKT